MASQNSQLEQGQLGGAGVPVFSFLCCSKGRWVCGGGADQAGFNGMEWKAERRGFRFTGISSPRGFSFLWGRESTRAEKRVGIM